MYHNNTHKTRRRLSLGCFLNRFYHFLLFPNQVLLLASTQICLSCHKIYCTRLDAFTRWYLVRWSEVRQRDRHRKLWILNAHASTSSSMFQFPSKYHQSEVWGKKTWISQTNNKKTHSYRKICKTVWRKRGGVNSWSANARRTESLRGTDGHCTSAGKILETLTWQYVYIYIYKFDTIYIYNYIYYKYIYTNMTLYIYISIHYIYIYIYSLYIYIYVYIYSNYLSKMMPLISTFIA